MPTRFAFAVLFIVFLFSWSSFAQQGGAPAPKVSVHTVQMQAVNFSEILPGRVSAMRQAHVRPQVQGIIKQRLFKEGAMVEAGEQLYQIDDAVYQAALQAAEADLLTAKANLGAVEARAKRYEKLLADQAVSQQDVDDIEAEKKQALAQIEVAKAAVEVAKLNVEYCKVYAPIGGRIGRALVTEGSLVTVNQAQQLATITQLDPIYVDIQQSAQQVYDLRSKLNTNSDVAVKLHVNGQLAPQYQGVLKFSEVTVSQSTGAATLRAEFSNQQETLLPGMFVEAQIEMGSQQVLLVPQRASVRQADGSLVVFVVDETNTVGVRPITYSRIYRDQYAVTSGLQAGDRIIITGYIKVQPGMQVDPQVWQG